MRKPVGIFHAVVTRDSTAQARDGWPYFVANRMPESLTDGQSATDLGGELFEVQFGDGVWMLARAADLSDP